MARPQEACIAARVHVQQVAGAGALVAVGRLFYRRRGGREPRTLEPLPPRRVRDPGRARHQPRTPAGLAATVADPLLQPRSQQTRRAVRTARAIPESLLPTLPVEPTMPPAMSR